MIEHKLVNGDIIFDVNQLLLMLVPNKLKRIQQNGHELTVLCGGFTVDVTKNNRDIVRLKNGTSVVAKISSYSGDKKWNNWQEFHTAVMNTQAFEKDEVFLTAIRNSNGGGMWVEVVIAHKKYWGVKDVKELESCSSRPNVDAMGLKESYIDDIK